MKHDAANPGTLNRQTRGDRLFIGCAMAFALTASMPAHALVLGITEGVMYRAAESQIEARFDPIADALSKAIKQPVTLRALNSYDNMREAAQAAAIRLGVLPPPAPWKEAGGKTGAESCPVPIKQRLASSKFDTALTTAVRDTLLGLSQSEVGKRALVVSSYSGFVSPSTDVEKTLTAWLGL